jgi:hypothetical protein
LVRADLVLLVIAAALGAFQVSTRALSTTLSLLALATLTVSIVITLVIKERKPEREWYGARAVAESVKSLAWKYMAGSEPFLTSLPPTEVDAMFSQALSSILENKRELSWEPGGLESANAQITEAMRMVRGLSLAERRDVYIQCRAKDQREWYSNRAISNRILRLRWFNAMIVCQGASIILAGVAAAFSGLLLSVVGVLTSLSASLLAWMQVKQYQELSQSYSIAAHELGLISAQLEHKQSEVDFSTFVADAESAMSREHTLWAARRDSF